MQKIIQLFIFFFCFCLLYVSYPNKAEASTVYVRSKVILTKTHGKYFYSNLKVESQGQLIIEPGVEVVIGEGGVVEVEGEISALGTNDNPIIFTAQPDLSWEGMTIKKGTKTNLAYLEFKYFEKPIVFEDAGTVFEHLTFTDGLDNRLVLGVQGESYQQTIYFKGLEFNNYLKGSAMKSTGLYLPSYYYADLKIESIKFNDQRDLPLADSNWLGIEVPSKIGSVELKDVIFPHGCAGRVYWDFPLNYRYFPDLKRCVSPIVPTLFVPGYGTSINLKKLLKLPDSEAEKEGWHFLEQLTPAYTVFLKELEQNEIPYAIAYYDWRLTAEDNVNLYLLPAIEALKTKYNSEKVNLVAHSFGGLISRSYIESSKYRGDVANLVMLGTPNYGAVKAYSVWEGAELPEDWASINYLIRYYQFISLKDQADPLEIVQKYLPSVKELMPIYPALKMDGKFLDPIYLNQANYFLINLNQHLDLLNQRVRVTTIASRTENTFAVIDLKNPLTHFNYWVDGEPAGSVGNKLGDGTVPWQSVGLFGASNLEASGTHPELPATSAEKVIETLYPKQKYLDSAQDTVSEQTPLNFLFDCPIEVKITSPNGGILDSTLGALQYLNSENTTLLGEVENEPEMIWMVTPRQQGTYSVQIKALESTPVRFWVDQGAINTLNVLKDQVVNLKYDSQIGFTNLADFKPLNEEVKTNNETLISQTQLKVEIPKVDSNKVLAVQDVSSVTSEQAEPKIIYQVEPMTVVLPPASQKFQQIAEILNNTTKVTLAVYQKPIKSHVANLNKIAQTPFLKPNQLKSEYLNIRNILILVAGILILALALFSLKKYAKIIVIKDLKKNSMKKILVVEDEQMLAKIIGMKLEEEKYEVSHAYDGQQAYDVLAGDKLPDLVLLDVLLPKMSGFDVLEKLKTENKKLPKIIVFSNFAQKADVERAHALGAVDYIVKAAFSPAEIITKIRSILDAAEVEAAKPASTAPAEADPYASFDSIQDVKPMSEVLRPGEPNNNP